MFKKFIFITILGLIASCGKEVKPVASREDQSLVIDTIKVVNATLKIEQKDTEQLNDVVRDQDLIVNVENGNFEQLGNLYYGSGRYSSLLKMYNGYKAADVTLTSKDSIMIPTFERLVSFTKENKSRRQRRSTDSLISVYNSYRAIENKLRSISELSDENTQLSEDIKRELNQLANNVAIIYLDLQDQEDRPHATIGELKALSSYFERMTQDSLQSNEKSVDIVHYRLAAAFKSDTTRL